MGFAPIRESCTDFHFPFTDDELTGPGYMNQLACEHKKEDEVLIVLVIPVLVSGIVLSDCLLLTFQPCPFMWLKEPGNESVDFIRQSPK